MFRGTLTAAVFFAAVGACQPLPRPFVPLGGAPADELLLPRQVDGVALLDLGGAPARVVEGLRGALVAALIRRGIPAGFSSGGRRSMFVYGEAVVRPARGQRVEVALDWKLVDPEGRARGMRRFAIHADDEAWRSGAAPLIASLAHLSADAVAAMLRDGSTTSPERIAADPRLFLAPVRAPPPLDGAPLRAAAARVLRATGLRMAVDRQAADLLLECRVTLEPVGEARRLMLSWRLADSGGDEIVRIRQEERLEAAGLAARWPALAGAIARALAPELRAAIAAGRPG